MRVVIDMRGVQEAFRRAPQLILSEMARGAKEGLTDMQRDARQAHRFKSRSGNLTRSIKVDFNNWNGRGLVIDKGIAPYGGIVHEGQRPHKIYPKNGKALRWAGLTKSGRKSKTRFIFSKFVNHPGTKPDQFVYQAAERGVNNLINKINAGVGRAIVKLGLKGR